MCQRRPWSGDRTTVHLTLSHLVSEDVWNTLLKVLEEPPPYCHFHLYAPSTDSLPRTIKSRSHVVRESLTGIVPDGAARLVRLYESGDAVNIIQEADRHTEVPDTIRAIESLWIYSIETGRLDAATLSEYHLSQVRRGASTRIVMKALLLELAIRNRQAANN